MREKAERTIRAYYAAFNRQDLDGFLDLLADDVVHDINQGKREKGKPAFRRFLKRMNELYRETVVDLVVMASADGRRAAAEFTIRGTYLKSDKGLPPASGQAYVLPVGAFFALKRGKVARVSNHYNLNDWLAQVAKPARGTKKRR
ncbi:MAG: nuclear transport factor 2 family protein [Alphaproteobacteria bacterium]|nr:nuclear transport factor 2 family protein [Alphaproteobacteria bacterium]